MRTGGSFFGHDFTKRVRRLFDGNYSYRKILLLIIVCGGFLLYFGPSIAQWFFSSDREPIDAFEDRCMKERLATFYFDTAEYNANTLHDPPENTEHLYLPYVGNGVFGVEITSGGWLYIRHGRTLSLAAHWQPLVSHGVPDGSLHREATVTHFTDGIVYKYQCLSDGYHVDSQYYAHRSLDGILVQDINIINPSTLTHDINFKLPINMRWSKFETKVIKISVEDTDHEYYMASGFVPTPDSKKMISIAIVYKEPPKVVQVKARGSAKIELLTSIQYSEPLLPKRYHAERELTENRAVEVMRQALIKKGKVLRDEHVSLWHSYWHSGIRISDSKAKDAVNGHKINSTIYYVLSQIPKGTTDVEKTVANNEGCYRGHHTLDAPKLWKDTSAIDGLNSVTKAWLITLEKQGCHRLLTGGPSAAQQAIILSLGGLLFSSQHLQFSIDPQYLHRDYLFRRISYGNVTHLNISVTVRDDNRAVLAVALDRSDSGYYGCDAGCLDDPVPLSQSYTNFPVKLTKPLTAILYVTSDHQHMQDLRNALHVHAVDDAPAHDHHLMALHKHGHQLGGLPTFFWVSICFLIVVFHLFLCKLIITEYCDHQDRQRTRYNKA